MQVGRYLGYICERLLIAFSVFCIVSKLDVVCADLSKGSFMNVLNFGDGFIFELSLRHYNPGVLYLVTYAERKRNKSGVPARCENTLRHRANKLTRCIPSRLFERLRRKLLMRAEPRLENDRHKSHHLIV